MPTSLPTEIAPGVFRVADTCNVYVIRDPAGHGDAVAVDFGTGRVFEHLAEMGVDRITDVLMTHHHRDQGQELAWAAAEGARIHVPPAERELFDDVDEMWQSRVIHNDYNQWSYVENEGPAIAVLSCLQLAEQRLDLLLPSHGEPMDDPPGALRLLASRLNDYIDSRRPYPWDLNDWHANPYIQLTEHLLQNRTSNSCSYVLLSRTGAALLIDYGYDMQTGLPPGGDRASRRPWLGSLPALRRRYGVTAIEVALPTHYHDDHVAGMNLLREVEGTEIWAPAHVAGILENPLDQDLPCTWYEPVRVDRRLPLGGTFRWQEYEIRVHDLPGHTLYAAAYEFVVDGARVLATGDQQVGMGGFDGAREVLNYQYRNRFRLGDYQAGARLYREIAAQLMIFGHWPARWVDDDYFQLVATEADDQDRLHRELLPLAETGIGPDGVLARIAPYYSRAESGATLRFRVDVSNPVHAVRKAVLRMVLPVGWVAVPDVVSISLSPLGREEVEIEVRAGAPRRRARLAVDVSIGQLHLGQHAEAIIDVRGPM